MAKATKATRGVTPTAEMANGEVVVELAYEAVRDGSARLVELAAELLGRVGPSAVPRLVEAAVRGRGPGQRLRALEAVARIGVFEDGLDRTTLLGLATHDPSPRVRRAALELAWELRLLDVEAADPGAVGATSDADLVPTGDGDPAAEDDFP